MFFKKKNKKPAPRRHVEELTTELKHDLVQYYNGVTELDFAIYYQKEIYLHTTPKLNLVSLGYQSARIEDLTEKYIELNEITNLPETNKPLATELIENGTLLLIKNEEKFTLFRQSILPLKLVK
jgi:hypothetical protein